jgi:hypothetical protein
MIHKGFNITLTLWYYIFTNLLIIIIIIIIIIPRIVGAVKSDT